MYAAGVANGALTNKLMQLSLTDEPAKQALDIMLASWARSMPGNKFSRQVANNSNVAFLPTTSLWQTQQIA